MSFIIFFFFCAQKAKRAHKHGRRRRRPYSSRLNILYIIVRDIIYTPAAANVYIYTYIAANGRVAHYPGPVDQKRVLVWKAYENHDDGRTVLLTNFAPRGRTTTTSCVFFSFFGIQKTDNGTSAATMHSTCVTVCISFLSFLSFFFVFCVLCFYFFIDSSRREILRKKKKNACCGHSPRSSPTTGAPLTSRSSTTAMPNCRPRVIDHVAVFTHHAFVAKTDGCQKLTKCRFWYSDGYNGTRYYRLHFSIVHIPLSPL